VTITEPAGYFPGISAAAGVAYDAYWTAHVAEDAAADACTQVHADADGARLVNDRCDADGPAGRAHRAALSAAAATRALYDDLHARAMHNLAGAAASDTLPDSTALGDDLTKLMHAVFSKAAGDGTVSGRTTAEQHRHDAVAPRTSWKG